MRPIFLLAFLFASPFAFGQKIHEVKTDVLLPSFYKAHLSYEFIPTSKIGVEAGVWYSWAESSSYYVPPLVLFNDAEGTYIPTKQQVLIATIATKYYFAHENAGTGPYVGGYIREDVLVSRRDARYEYLTIHNYSSSQGDPQHNRQLRFALGLMTGYKGLIGKHFMVEVGVGLDIILQKNQDFDLAGIPAVKVGYRF